MIKNRFESRAADQAGSPTVALAVEPSDTEELPEVMRAIWVGTAGDVCVQYLGHKDISEAVTHRNLLPGVWHPMQIVRVLATGTTARDIVVGV
ncbi:spike base protein, RCAP_Rcc01079 family [Bordetella avium]|nr:hypothetical protein [Bordetella avium]AZY52243.1 hypothetical protein C0J07_06780 [Bordetella avium]RIQ47778.1 hypothetical protein D0843_16605 [Bordetella avium]